MLVAALSATDKATIALASVTGVLVLVAVFQLVAFVRSEARRTQPVAILHRRGGPDPLNIPVFMTNEGVGTAYNVRVGVRLYGIEHPLPLPLPLGDHEGHRYLLQAGQRIPPEGEEDYALSLPAWAYVAGRWGRSKPRHVFYARYENAFGKTWETRNPKDPLASFQVRRRWFWRARRRPHARWQRRKRASAERRVMARP
jgi:hypothetical protein